MKFIKKEWQPLARPNGEDMNDLEQRILEISDTDSSTPQVVDVGNNLNFNPLYHPVFGQMDVGSIVSFASGENPNTGNPFSSSGGPSGIETNPPVVGTIERASSTIFIMTIRPQGTNFTDVLDWRERIFSNNTWREWNGGNDSSAVVSSWFEDAIDTGWHGIALSSASVVRSGAVVTVEFILRNHGGAWGSYDSLLIGRLPVGFRPNYTRIGTGHSWDRGTDVRVGRVVISSSGEIRVTAPQDFNFAFNMTYIVR